MSCGLWYIERFFRTDMNSALSILLIACTVVHVCSGENEGRRPRYLMDSRPQWGSWSSYSACSPSCNGGRKTRTRGCYKNGQQIGSNNCPGIVAMEYKMCTQSDCVPSGNSCSDVHDCTKYPSDICSGYQYAQWSKTYCARFCGYCGAKPTIVPQTPTPPLPSAFSAWTSWSRCSVTCGKGAKSRSRYCPGPGTCMGHNYETVNCYFSNCQTTTMAPAVNGNWGPWTGLSSCTKTCGAGLSTKTRVCNNPAPSGRGQPCKGSSSLTVNCQVRACSVDGGWGSWASWSACSKSCDLGTLSRARACNNPFPSGGGATCTGNSAETHECSNGPCPAWSHWVHGDCSVSCGNGTMERMRHCSTGRDSDCGGNGYEMVPCSNIKCV